MAEPETPRLSPVMLPFEVQAIILRYAVNDILLELRRTDTDTSYTTRLQRWLSLRLASKSFDSVLSQLTFGGEPLDALLRRKQLEKLDYALEAIQVMAESNPLNSRLSVPKMKRLCGKFWHNPDLSADTVRRIFSLLPSPQSLNFAAKLEHWIYRHRARSETSTCSPDSRIFFDIVDWIIDAGALQIRRVSRIDATPHSRLGLYLAHEMAQPFTPVHSRLGHERRWVISYADNHTVDVLYCMVNYKTKMVWDHLEKRLYDFDGQQYAFPGSDSDAEEESGEEQY